MEKVDLSEVYEEVYQRGDKGMISGGVEISVVYFGIKKKNL